MRRHRILLVILIIPLILSFGGRHFTAYAATDGITRKINELRNKFPDGKYWNHVRRVSGDDGDTLLKTWNNSYGDYVSDHGCATHNGVASIGQYDCNAFDGAIQCYGFANKVFYDIFGEHCPNLSRRTDISNISIGDHIRFTEWGEGGHSAIVIARSGDTLTLVEGNYGNHCMIKWGRTVSLSGSGIVGFYHASNWQTVYNDKGSFYLDVNGILNGAASGGLLDYGTCDVYINGSRVADDVNDYYTAWPSGTTYEIRDIRPTAQHTYSGSGSYSGTIGTAQVNINLAFDTYGTLTVNGWLDTKVSSDIGGYGTFDVYINGRADGTGLTSYSKKWPKGTTFEICNPQASEDHLYEGTATGSPNGTLGTGTSTVTLSFTTKGHPTGEWTYTKRLPGNITADNCDIEYQYTETRTAAASPGSGWVKKEGSETTKYENDGGVYDSDFELSTSSTRVYVGSYYYHYCGASTGNNVEHYNDGSHTDYHPIGDINQYYVSGGPYTDDLDPRYSAYQLKWVSGEWADGLAYCSAGRSAIYYRRYQYQNKKAVTYYTWTKTSDWLTEPSGSGTPSQYRYRLKDMADPVIDSVKVTEITPTGFTVTCSASDDSGITKLAVSSWTDTETEANAKVNEAVPASADNKVEISITIPVSEHNNEMDVNYNVKFTVYDKVGNTAEYTENVEVFIPMLVRSSEKLVLPSGLKEIKEEAFAGSTVFGEVYIPSRTEKIGSRAFADCSHLVLISIPNSVTEIADDAFERSRNVVILCSIDSEAAAFAKRNGIPYLTTMEISK